MNSNKMGSLTSLSPFSTFPVFCEAGFYSDNNITCLPCPIGTYKDARGNEECTPCTGDVTTETTGSDQASDCYLSKDNFDGEPTLAAILELFVK